MQGIKHDQDKARVDLVPPGAIIAASRAFKDGLKKYDEWNWLKGFRWLRVYAALQRHLLDWMMGIEKDPGSGLHPLDHALANLMMLQVHIENGLGKDDRPVVKLDDPLPSDAFTFASWTDNEGVRHIWNDDLERWEAT